MELKKNETFLDALTKQVGKIVDIVLKNGQIINCKVILAGQFCTHVERLDSKSFYDTIIRNEDIIAIEVKVRS
ncbi:MAG: hypothetical protein JW891_00110 [Candidatus Lokiarchaeota archaeon]|nr:hypothetical protein [Candidatus Lokiarchaeota archaeon]